MPPNALVMLVLWSALGSGQESAGALLAALEQELGGQMHAAVTADAGLSDEQALEMARARSVPLVARLEWPDQRERHARVVVLRTDRAVPAVQRELSFSRQDAPRERGRAIGLVLAAVVRSFDLRPAAGPPVLAASPPAPPAPESHAMQVLGEIQEVGGAYMSGASLSYGVQLAARLRVDATAVLRFGTPPSVGGSYSAIGIGAGVAVPLLARPRWGILALAGVLALREHAGGFESSGNTAGTRWNAVFRPGFEACLRLRGPLWLAAALGLEVPVSTRNLEGDDGRHAVLGRWRPMAGLGFAVTM